MTRVAIAGCTGSIGTQALEVVAGDPQRYEVVALSAGSSVDAVVEQAHQWRPKVIVVADPVARAAVAARVGFAEVVGEVEALVEVADVVVNGVVGFAGLEVTVATLRAGRRLALANKESLVAAGPVVQPLRAVPGAELVPVDSEHSALHQCLRSGDRPQVEVGRLLLTASGGPFRGRRADDLAHVTVADALAHPTWAMGPKITVDSSTLMNKGLEVIEAHELFGIDYDRIDVVVHPQSIVHSMVEWTDGSTIAQLSLPDMRLPIAYALAWPHRAAVAHGRIASWADLGALTFEAPDRHTFACLDLAYAAGRAGGSVPCWLNAANEVAVAAFLDGRLTWPGIARVVSATLDAHDPAPMTTVDDVVAHDAAARRVAADLIERSHR